jgi:hypothetical protein
MTGDKKSIFQKSLSYIYIIKQTEIINELKCKFFRIKEMDFDDDKFIQEMIAEKI